MDAIEKAHLEKEFTSMLLRTGTYPAYWNLANNYLTADKDYIPLEPSERASKLASLRGDDPKQWISQVFTEGLDIPPTLYQANILWLKHLGGN